MLQGADRLPLKALIFGVDGTSPKPRSFTASAVAWQLIGVFLKLCGSFVVSDDAAMGGDANKNEMVARVVSAAGSAYGICPDCGAEPKSA